jgi:hypothetical protein
VRILKYGGISCLALALCTGAASALIVSSGYGQGTPAPKPQRVRAKLDGFDIEPKSGKAPNQVGGASRDLGGKLVLYAPKMAKSYTLTPTFLWSSDDPSNEYLFQISVLSAGQGQVYETKVKGGMLTYPADAPPLVPGSTYVWRVTPVNDLMGGPASATVLVIGGEERAKVAAALHGDDAADARVYVANRIWYDALGTYTRLIQSHPEHAEYWKGRGELYDQLPQMQDLADADMARAQH